MELRMNISCSILLHFLLSYLNGARCHSWLACTDYTEKAGKTWNPGKCRGFPRSAYRKAPKDGVFGMDHGFDNIPNEQRACQVPRNDHKEYTHDHPMAVYYPGQQVVLVHPMKNHGADIGCTNIHIPDTGSWIFRSERNANRDPSLSEFRRKLVFDLGRSKTGKDFNGNHQLSHQYPKPGFQNAPLFCSNTDKAMATYVMNVPKNLEPGIYTFMWLWAFNDLKNLYSTCFEVEIVRNKIARDNKLFANGFMDTTEPCGGMTSNENIKGNTNDGCTPLVDATGILDYTYAVMPSEPVTTTTNIPHVVYSTPRTLSTYPILSNHENSDYTDDESGYNFDTEESDYGSISGVNMEVQLSMSVLQHSGEIGLPAPRSTAVRRYYAIDFSCDVDIANFWNCRIYNEEVVNAPNSPKRHYIVVQEGDKELQSLRIYYHVNHKQPCDMLRYPPSARLVREEYANI